MNANEEMLILMLVILMLILMLLKLNTGYADTDAGLCIRIMSLCYNILANKQIVYNQRTLVTTNKNDSTVYVKAISHVFL